MPPYASQEHNNNDGQSPAVLDNNHHDLSLLELPSAPKTIEALATFDATGMQQQQYSDGMPPVFDDLASVSSSSTSSSSPEKETKEVVVGTATTTTTTMEPQQQEQQQQPSILDRLLDFNPCTIKISNPASALFKIRTCSECGDRVHKFRNGGYRKEEHLRCTTTEESAIPDDDYDNEGSSGIVAGSFDDDSTMVTKVYYHGDCLRRREDRAAHRDIFATTVLPELASVFEARERERREAEERKRRAAEEAAYAAAIAQAAALAEASAANAPREGTTTTRKKRFPLLRRAKKVFESFSFKACRGASNSTNTTDESAFRGAEI